MSSSDLSCCVPPDIYVNDSKFPLLGLIALPADHSAVWRHCQEPGRSCFAAEELALDAAIYALNTGDGQHA